LKVVAGIDQLNVTFDPPSNNGGSSINKYVATATPANGDPPMQGESTTSTQITIAKLHSGMVYTVSVAAVSDAGTGTPASAVVSTLAAPTAPGSPTNLKVNPSANQLEVSFDAPTMTGGSQIKSYTATATPANGGSPITADGTSWPIVIPGLQSGVVYTISVVARNDIGPSPATSIAATTK
jgi:hypothetical protein